MKLYQKVYYILYIFCFLFAPPLITGINFSLILFFYTLILLIFKYPKQFLNVLHSKNLVIPFLLLSFYILINFLSYLINTIFFEINITNNFLLNMYSFFLNFIVIFTCSIYVIIKAQEYSLTINELIKFFIYATLLQVFVSILSLVNPEFKEWTLNKMLKDTNQKLINSPWITSRRFYGFSNNLLDLFGFGIGIISSIMLFLSNENKKWIFLIPLVLILSILNSRSGLVIFLIGVICYFFYLIITRKISAIKLIKYMCFYIVIVILLYQIINYFSPNTIDWIKNDFLSFLGENNRIGTANSIFSKRFWRLPDDWRIFFGNGYSISGYSDSKVDEILHSDCGYVNEIWKVGIFGLLIYLLFLFYIIKTCIKLDNNICRKHMYMFFMLSMLVFMVKASLFGYNPGNVIIYTIFIYHISKIKLKGMNKNEK